MERLPADLKKVLALNKKASLLWQTITPVAKRDFITWIESAKQEETRKRRVDSVPSRLLSGKRRPCCYAVVPMNFYKALGLSPKAKKQWGTLTPDEKRDFVAWVEAPKEPSERRARVEKACAVLSLGKQRP